ncbi:hypothetical protein [Rhizobium leguminosarum]|uniref:hypothetical protein n=1 Tax=Rhizobium leguminosarum TaxID=384 RepID=UPI0013B96CBA|nr:hypothetical protein [Rhizobium leguminosarum]MBY5324441.1 hypothetical protein [Rhizobium leguminosarum]MBY5385721.1 hypothetical protein [Rhizobium leguminosarum]MCA2436035.1 hypothetical protein [Rhizobium leguminosarum]NEH74045.1 hypothetical protein [Rhizobium leguminosarum]
METIEDLLARLRERHPEFPRWVGTLTPDVFGVSFCFAVIDRWRRELNGSVDALHEKLRLATVEYNVRQGCAMPVPPKEEFAGYVALHLPMVLRIPWQRIRGQRTLPTPDEPSVRIRRSR